MSCISSPTIQINNLSTGYFLGKRKVKQVAQDIQATIYSGELTCLLGANGVGKSTLLRTLSGFQPKISGEILIQGKEIAQYTEKELARVISVVLTEKTSIHNTTVRELISIGRSPYTNFWGSLTDADKNIVDQAIKQVNIAHLTDRLIETLSDGERQKVMIAKALAQQTPIILLDEPTAFLDFPSKVEIMQLLRRLSQEMDKTIFLSTHDLELALQIADKIWLVNAQAHIDIGTPEDLALDGTLANFFATDEIIFDEHTGLFRVKGKKLQQVYLTGDNPYKSMVSKALMRRDIGVVFTRQTPTQIHIHASNKAPHIQIANHHDTIHCQNIEELLHLIKKINPTT